jgi:hypothetical protein
MAANHFAAIWAFPQFFLFFQKPLHPVFFDELGIVYHAHFVSGFVSSVNCFQRGAWKIWAFKTESHFTLQQCGALFFQESTFFVSRSTACTIRYSDTFAFHIVHQRQIVGAKCTVHSARRNQVRTQVFSSSHLTHFVSVKELLSSGFKYFARNSMMKTHVEKSPEKTCTPRKNSGKKRQNARTQLLD